MAAPARAQNGTSLPAGNTEFEARLSQTLREHRYADFEAILRNPGPTDQALRLVNWLREKMLAGEGTYVALSYSRLLMAFGESKPSLKDTAAMAALYAQGLVLTEGVRCADSSAAQSRLQHVVELTGPMNRHLMQLPLERRRVLVDNAISMETVLAPDRRNDDWLCRGGAGAAASALDPRFLPEAEWRPKQIDGRAQFQKIARELFLQPDAKGTVSAPPVGSPAPSAPPAARAQTTDHATTQNAKAPTAVARQGGMDGEYRTTVPANLFNGNPPFEMRITAHGGNISGYGTVPQTRPMHCKAQGTMRADGDAYFEIDCVMGGISAVQTFQISGRFAPGADGKVAGNTNYRLGSGPSGTLLWRAM